MTYSTESLEKTIRVCQAYLKEPLTLEDAREMTENRVHLLSRRSKSAGRAVLRPHKSAFRILPSGSHLGMPLLRPYTPIAGSTSRSTTVSQHNFVPETVVERGIRHAQVRIVQGAYVN